MNTIFRPKIKRSAQFLRLKNRLWDLPRLAIRTGKKNLSEQVDNIVYGG